MTADAVSGGDRRLQLWLEAQPQPCVLAVKRIEPLWIGTEHGPRELPAAELAAAVAAAVAPAAWTRLRAGDGAKGPRLYDWARVAIRPLREPGWAHWLRIRRSLIDPHEPASDVSFAPAGTQQTRWAGWPGRAGRSLGDRGMHRGGQGGSWVGSV